MSAVERAFCRSALWRPASRRTLTWSLAGERLDGEVLEIGAGSGEMAAELLRRHDSLIYTASDIDPAMVRDASHRLAACTGVSVTTADVTGLDVADATYDVVLSFLMLHHVVDWKDGIAEIARVLRPGGRLIGYDLLATRLSRAVHTLDGSPVRLLEREELATACATAGLEVRRDDVAFAGQVSRFCFVRS